MTQSRRSRQWGSGSIRQLFRPCRLAAAESAAPRTFVPRRQEAIGTFGRRRSSSLLPRVRKFQWSGAFSSFEINAGAGHAERIGVKMGPIPCFEVRFLIRLRARPVAGLQPRRSQSELCTSGRRPSQSSRWRMQASVYRELRRKPEKKGIAGLDVADSRHATIVRNETAARSMLTTSQSTSSWHR